MRSVSKHFFVPFFALALLISCKTIYQPRSVTYADYRITAVNVPDNNIVQLLQPYADSVNKSMSAVVAVAAVMLEKKQPESTLGNILADAMLVKATQVYKINVDAAFINYGGIRLTNIPSGNITRGKIFEVAPFDNVIVLLQLKGTLLQEFLNHISGRGGWPAAGISWQIKNLPAGVAGKTATNILVNATPLNENATYTIAVADYVANGGDDAVMLKQLPQINNGYLFRDAVIEYFTDINNKGKKIEAKLENRVTNAE